MLFERTSNICYNRSIHIFTRFHFKLKWCSLKKRCFWGLTEHKNPRVLGVPKFHKKVPLFKKKLFSGLGDFSGAKIWPLKKSKKSKKINLYFWMYIDAVSIKNSTFLVPWSSTLILSWHLL